MKLQLHISYLSSCWKTQYESKWADCKCYGSFPRFESGGFDGDDALDHRVEQSQALADTQHDQAEVEQHTPEGRNVLRSQDWEICWDELGGQSVNLIPRFTNRVQIGWNDSDPCQIRNVIVFWRAGWLQSRLWGGRLTAEHVVVVGGSVHLVIFQIVEELPWLVGFCK